MQHQSHRQPQREQVKPGRDSGTHRDQPLPDGDTPEHDSQPAHPQHPDRMQAGKPQRNARDQRAGHDDADAGQTALSQDEDGLPLTDEPNAPDEGGGDDALSSGTGRAKGRRR